MTTHLLDPVFHSNQRTEFRIPGNNKVLLSNMRLADFGAKDIVAGGGNNYNILNVRYGASGGIYNMIRKITLFSNTETLDQLNDCARIMSYRNLLQDNNALSNLNRYLLHSALDLTEVNALNNDPLEISGDNKLLGRINLANVLEFCRQQVVLPHVKDLRLVIEYESDVNKVFQLGANQLPQAFQVNQPFLIVDELLGKDASDETKSFQVTFPSYELERVHLAQNPVNTVQKENIRLKAFDGKMTHCLIIANDDTGNGNLILGHHRSKAYDNETFQFVVNSRRLLPLNGISNAQDKLAKLHDSQGIAFIPLLTDLPTSVLTGAQANTILGAGIVLLRGELSYLAVDVYTVINELRLEYSRTDDNNAQPATDLNVIGKVARYVSMDGQGHIKTGYA